MESNAPDYLKLWICCHCGSPRLYGSSTECKTCGALLHDTAEYSRITAPIVAPTDALKDLFALFTRDAAGHWNFNSLSRDADKLDEVMERLSAAPIVAPEVDEDVHSRENQ